MEKENLYSPEMLIDLIIEGDLSISRIAKETNIPLPTLKNYVYGKTDAASMQYRMIKDLTEFFRNGQPLEAMIKEYDFVMIDCPVYGGRDIPYIDDLQVHTFKTLAELHHRKSILYKDKSYEFDPFLVVLTEEILHFFQSDISNYWFFTGLIDNVKKLNLKFITSKQIIMSDNLTLLRDRLSLKDNFEMFFNCSDNEALKKLSEMDETLLLSKRPLSIEASIKCIMTEYAYYLLLGDNSSSIAFELLDNLEPGCLNNFWNSCIMSDPVPKNKLLPVIFDTATSKYDFITAINLSDYENLFNNKRSYFIESQFTQEVVSGRYESFTNLKYSLVHLKVEYVDNHITEIENPIRPNHFDIKSFILENRINTTESIIINAASKFLDEFGEEKVISRYLIHSIEYTNLDGEKCTYKF